MPAFTPTLQEKEHVQQFYELLRSMIKNNTLPVWSVHRSFDELMHGYMLDYSWQPSHVSRSALEILAQGNKKDLQRAHGAIAGKINRYDRAQHLLVGPELPFDQWIQFYIEHDATVIMTKQEHSSEKIFVLDELIPLPPRPHNLFTRAGFSCKIRKNMEIAWAKSMLNELNGDSIA